LVRPFAVELLRPQLGMTPGGTVSLRGRLLRRPVFKEPVQLRLDGLPAGVMLAAPPRPIPGTAADFQLDLKATLAATPATTFLTLICSTSIGGVGYNHPPVAIPFQIKPAK
jgi:hypothetical protein